MSFFGGAGRVTAHIRRPSASPKDTNAPHHSSFPIKKIPTLTYAKEIGVREWPFDCGQIDTFIGGIDG